MKGLSGFFSAFIGSLIIEYYFLYVVKILFIIGLLRISSTDCVGRVVRCAADT